MVRASINPKLLRWARERAKMEQEALARRFKKLPQWETGHVQPTFKQLEDFARAVHVPLGYMFLSEPPDETVPIPDFRTFAGQSVTRPSPHLLDTIYDCQERQDWYRDFARNSGAPRLDFVGSASLEDHSVTVATRIRTRLGVDLPAQGKHPQTRELLQSIVRRADESGILVMVSGIVKSNTHRPLDPAEFCGFALCDPYAPLIFINGKNSKSAQLFTLAHELGHIWLGKSALSNTEKLPKKGSRDEEVWCNAVAAEFLVPMETFRSMLRQDEPLAEAMTRLARTFNVTTSVILRRLLDAEWLTQERYESACAQERNEVREVFKSSNSDGTSFLYRLTVARVGKRFTRELIVSTLEGQTLFRDAFRMLGIVRSEAFNKLGREIGVMK